MWSPEDRRLQRRRDAEFRTAAVADSWRAAGPSSRNDRAMAYVGLLHSAFCILHLRDGSSAIDDDRLSGDVIRRVRSEEDGHALQLASISDAWNGAGGLDMRLGVDDRRIGQPRMEEPGRDGIDPNVAAPPRRRELARQSHQAGLTRRVAGVMSAIHRGVQPRDGRDVDDAPVL